jgi:hypothetical protein
MNRGKSDNYETRENNEAQHRTQILIGKLPKTIRDAVKICRELNIYYLWVDALCILQDHGAAEWIEEAGNIDKIYGFATFTLAVSSSSDSKDGFYENQGNSLLTSTPEQVTIAHHRVQVTPRTLEEMKHRSPLDSRGWAFQEERLSPRIVHWTSQGVFWTCLHGHHSEADRDIVLNKPGQSRSYFEDFTEPYYQESREGIPKVVEVSRLWSKLIEAYSLRNFTKMEDRLSALSGLAKKYAAEIASSEGNSQYIAGHWSNFFHSELLWVIGLGTDGRLDKRTISKLENMPSWSWVSVSPVAGVLFPRRYGRPTYHQLDSPANIEDCSGFSNTCIYIKARLRPLLNGEAQVEWPNRELQDDLGHAMFPNVEGVVYSIDPKTKRIMIAQNNAAPIIIETDYGIPVLERCYCLEVNRNGFLLLEKLYDCEAYQRVGCAQWHEDRTFFANCDAVAVNLV